MGFIQMKSDNPGFSMILRKNPNSGLQLKKSEREGLFMFWFSKNDSVFNIYFIDPSDEVSYRKHDLAIESEYLNPSRYNNARIINDALSEVLNSARGKEEENDTVGFNYSFIINLIETDFKTIDIFQRYYNLEKEGIDISFEEIEKNNFKVTFNTKEKTLKHLLNVVNLFGLFASLNSEDYIYVDEHMVKKYVKLINVVDAPYFIRYLLKIRLIRSENKFLMVSNDLSKSSLFKYNFLYGDTHEMRIRYIKERLTFSKSVIDIGTGEDARYLKFIAAILAEKGLMYYSIEKDEEAREEIKRTIKNRLLENVELYESLDDFIEQNNTMIKTDTFEIVCTEVLEHNHQEEAKSILKKVINNIKFSLFISTVPNKEFNTFYGLESKMRHSDHKWEISKNDFQNWVLDEIPEVKKYSYSFEGIGDSVNNIQVSTSLILK